jgi:phage terminase Nu1 subunit (DNA packaging protein)
MINLPQGNATALPNVPETIKQKSPEVYQYLVDLRRTLGTLSGKLVDNDRALQDAINTGATGTFLTTGAGFVFVNGILTSTA